MLTAIKSWGNSCGIRLPKEVLESANLSVDDEVSLEVVDKAIIIKRATPKTINIKELFENYSDSFKGEEFDWGPNQGEEVF